MTRSTTLQSKPAAPLAGEAQVPGDKSISHRALMIGASATNETVVDGLLESADVLATAAALRALGVEIERGTDGTWHVLGRGVGGLAAPDTVLDLGNSGTGARLLAGLVASHPFTTVITGDASLRSRPMARIIEPLERMGAAILARPGGRLPMTVQGAHAPLPVDYRLPVPSAQVKSAILLAGLNTPGLTTVIEAARTRDHTERMLGYFGVPVETTDTTESERQITIRGHVEIQGIPVSVPADPSSAAFAAVAAAVVPGSNVRLAGVGVNPLRTGIFNALRDMGASIDFANVREDGPEPIADIVVTAAPLEGVRVPADVAPTMIDEYPALAVAAACARGKSRFEGLGELRVKESDRLEAIARGLTQCGVEVEAGDDFLVVHGAGGPPPGLETGTLVACHSDHRIAMAFLVLGIAAQRPVAVDSGDMIETSFPGFAAVMNGLGASIG